MSTKETKETWADTTMASAINKSKLKTILDIYDIKNIKGDKSTDASYFRNVRQIIHFLNPSLKITKNTHNKTIHKHFDTLPTDEQQQIIDVLNLHGPSIQGGAILSYETVKSDFRDHFRVDIPAKTSTKADTDTEAEAEAQPAEANRSPPLQPIASPPAKVPPKAKGSEDEKKHTSPRRKEDIENAKKIDKEIDVNESENASKSITDEIITRTMKKIDEKNPTKHATFPANEDMNGKQTVLTKTNKITNIVPRSLKHQSRHLTAEYFRDLRSQRVQSLASRNKGTLKRNVFSATQFKKLRDEYVI